MDSLLPSIFFLVLMVIIDAVFFGFGAATQSVNVTELEQKMEDGDRKAGRILRIVNRPGGFVNSIQILWSGIARTRQIPRCTVWRRPAGAALWPCSS